MAGRERSCAGGAAAERMNAFPTVPGGQGDASSK